MKTVLVGMCNPQGNPPLWPEPINGTGWRILQLLRERCPDITQEGYIGMFDRENLCSGPVWKPIEAQVKALELRATMRGRTLVLLGNEVRKMFAIPPVWVYPYSAGGITFRQLPHPSGRCRWYNDEDNRRVAAKLLEELSCK